MDAIPKVFANVYIDDAGLGTPLLLDRTKSRRPFVNWEQVMEYLHDAPPPVEIIDQREPPSHR
jgi:hypothetical protein